MSAIALFGSRGYLGRELVRLLHRHPAADELLFISSSQQGTRYRAAVPGFHAIEGTFTSAEDALAADPDFVFFATGNGVASKWAPECGDATVIDLSRDHRGEALAGGGPWHYGLADVWPTPKGHPRIANPGCYPTASLLASLPALQAGLAEGPLIADGKSGVSGAGATPREDLHFPAANEATRAYKVLGHDHLAEIKAAAGNAKGAAVRTRFTPHLVPQSRGLLSTVYLMTDASADDVQAAYEKAYADAPFVHMGQEPDSSHVRGTNHAHVAVDVDDGILVARCAIDNLQKGGSGQAVQNMNLVLGLDPTTGLDHAGGAP